MKTNKNNEGLGNSFDALFRYNYSLSHFFQFSSQSQPSVTSSVQQTETVVIIYIYCQIIARQCWLDALAAQRWQRRRRRQGRSDDDDDDGCGTDFDLFTVGGCRSLGFLGGSSLATRRTNYKKRLHRMGSCRIRHFRDKSEDGF